MIEISVILDTEVIPDQQHLIEPVYDAMKQIGEPCTNDEIIKIIVDKMGLAPDVLFARDRHGNAIFAGNVNWAKVRLRKVGAIESISRGKWKITEKFANVEHVNGKAVMEATYYNGAPIKRRRVGILPIEK